MKPARDSVSAKRHEDKTTCLIFAAKLGSHSALIDLLCHRGYEVSTENHPEGLQRCLLRQTAAAVVLDLDHLGERGWDILKGLRERTLNPIVVLTSVDENSFEIDALQYGADLVIPIKCSPYLIVERLAALLRRSPLSSREGGLERNPLCHGHLELDVDRFLVMWKGERVTLSKTEFELVRFLVERPGHVRTREQIQDRLYGANNSVFERTIDSHVKRIRCKFGQIDSSFASIEALYGLGYLFAEEGSG